MAAITANVVKISFNGSSSSFSGTIIEGSGSTVSSFQQGQFAGAYEGASFTSNTFSNNEIYIPNYTSSNYKSFIADSVTENNSSTAYSELIAGLWSNTAAITSITLSTSNVDLFVQYSKFSLYGVLRQGI